MGDRPTATTPQLGLPQPPQRRVARALLLEHELERIAEACARAGLDLIVLKGVPLARQLFDGPADRQREQQDNDLLVRRDDLTRALAVLEALGYRLPSAYRHRHPLAAREPDWQLPLVYRHEGVGRVLAELHWTPFPPRLFPVPSATLWKHSVEYRLRGGAQVRVFDRALTLIHLASHYVQHAGAGRWILEDFAAGWTRWAARLGAEPVAALARELRLHAVLAYTLAHAQQLDMIADAEAVPALRSRTARLLAQACPPRTGAQLSDNAQRVRTAALACLADPTRIPGALAAEAWPPLTTMARLHDQPVGPGLLAHYAVRPLRPIMRLFRTPHAVNSVADGQTLDGAADVQ